MNIIKALVICVVAGWMLIKASGAHAQIPVTDGASIATDVMNHIGNRPSNPVVPDQS